MVVHNETSTGATSRIADIRAAIDRAAHPALLMVDTISSLGSWRHRVAKWPVSTIRTLSPGDSVLTIAASQAPVPDLLAEGFHAAAWPRLQRDLGQGARGLAQQQDAAFLFRLGGNACRKGNAAN